jgi:hypothetical protein
MDFTHLVSLEWILAELEAVGRAIMDAEPVAALERLEALRRELRGEDAGSESVSKSSESWLRDW